MSALSIQLTTSDNVKIAGKYIPGSLPFGVVLLHMMPATKESFDEFAEKLSALGLHTLVIDFRGHGESGGGNYQEFTDEQHQAYASDIEAAVEYLKKQNPNIKIGFVGASIGANFSLIKAQDPKTIFAVSLSAGLVYYGVDAFGAMAKIPMATPVYFASARDDVRKSGNNNAVMTEQLYNACISQNKSIALFETGGHGTDLFKTHPDLQAKLINWIDEIVIKMKS